MIRFARRHPFIAGLALGVPVVIAGASYNGTLGAVLLLLWAIACIFCSLWSLVGWTSLHTKSKPPPVDLGIPRPVAPVASWLQPAPVQTHPAFAAPTLGDVLMLTAAQFEELCRDLLTACGFEGMTRTGGAGDLGADVKGRDRQGRSVIVQAKRYAPGNQVGSPVMQSFIGMMTVQHHADRGVFITSATFSLPALNLAQAHGVTLIDGPTLLTLMALTGIGPAGQPAMPVQTIEIPNEWGGTLRGPTFNARPEPVPAALTSLASPNGSPQSNVARQPKFCTNCGRAVENDSMFCPECGAGIKRVQV